MFRVLPIHRKLQLQVHTVKGHVEWLLCPPGHGYSSTSCQIKVPTRPSGVRVITAGSAKFKKTRFQVSVNAQNWQYWRYINFVFPHIFAVSFLIYTFLISANLYEIKYQWM